MMGEGMHRNGGMMQMQHPVHIHQRQVNILKRNAEEVDRNL